MSNRFHARKQIILKQLSVPDENYADSSPKGSIDIGIRELIDEINGTSGLVSTSSCSGRIAVFLEGPPNVTAPTLIREGEETAATSAVDGTCTGRTSGKGGGRWLYTSHEPVSLERYPSPGATFERVGFSSDAELSFPSSKERVRYVHFKFEAMILHILTASTNEAQVVLNAAMSAGFRESGISGIFDSKGRPTNPMVAVRSSGLGMDSVIGFQPSLPGTCNISPMVSESYLLTLIQIANDRFKVNTERTTRFRSALMKHVLGSSISVPKSPHGANIPFEPSRARKERMRKEGILRQESLRASAGTSSNLSGEQSESVDDNGVNHDFNIDLLTADSGDTEAQTTTSGSRYHE